MDADATPRRRDGRTLPAGAGRANDGLSHANSSSDAPAGHRVHRTPSLVAEVAYKTRLYEVICAAAAAAGRRTHPQRHAFRMVSGAAIRISRARSAPTLIVSSGIPICDS